MAYLKEQIAIAALTIRKETQIIGLACDLVQGRDRLAKKFALFLAGTGSVEWEWLPILKQSLIQMPVQFSRDPYVVEIPGRMGICMPYVVYPINASRVLVRALFYIQIA
jgi:hypothetical protein